VNELDHGFVYKLLPDASVDDGKTDDEIRPRYKTWKEKSDVV
jgi:hypothetical protein